MRNIPTPGAMFGWHHNGHSTGSHDMTPQALLDALVAASAAGDAKAAWMLKLVRQALQ